MIRIKKNKEKKIEKKCTGTGFEPWSEKKIEKKKVSTRGIWTLVSRFKRECHDHYTTSDHINDVKLIPLYSNDQMKN